MIGNGFDLYHGIKSSYADFRLHLKRVNPELHELVESHLQVNENWADFESTLAHLDGNGVLDKASGVLQPYRDDDWSDASHYDYQYEVEKTVEALSQDLKAELTAWATALKIQDATSCPVPLLPLDVGAWYLNFNYTSTLQHLYRIAPDLVFHLHNAVADHQPDLVLGHAINPSRRQPSNHGLDLEAQDTRVTEANDILDNYFSATYKPTLEVIKKHRGYFESLEGIDEIYVVGHSLSEVDIPYFVKIIDITGQSDPRWVVTYYTQSNLQEMKSALVGAGVPNHKVRFVGISSLPS